MAAACQQDMIKILLVPEFKLINETKSSKTPVVGLLGRMPPFNKFRRIVGES